MDRGGRAGDRKRRGASCLGRTQDGGAALVAIGAGTVCRLPYKFALSGILKLKPREEAAALEQLDP